MSLNNRFDAWFNRQSVDTQLLIALSPLITVGLVLTILGLTLG